MTSEWIDIDLQTPLVPSMWQALDYPPEYRLIRKKKLFVSYASVFSRCSEMNIYLAKIFQSRLKPF